MRFTVKVDLPSAEELIRKKGLGKNGDVQRFHTMNVNRRITRYMPYRTGALSTKLKHVVSDTEIEIIGPYARYQYFGKVMVGKAPKVATDKPLNQKPHSPGNDRAGPFWDRALVAAEGDQLTRELQEYIDGRKG